MLTFNICLAWFVFNTITISAVADVRSVSVTFLFFDYSFLLSLCLMILFALLSLSLIRWLMVLF